MLNNLYSDMLASAFHSHVYGPNSQTSIDGRRLSRPSETIRATQEILGKTLWTWS